MTTLTDTTEARIRLLVQIARARNPQLAEDIDPEDLESLARLAYETGACQAQDDIPERARAIFAELEGMGCNVVDTLLVSIASAEFEEHGVERIMIFNDDAIDFVSTVKSEDRARWAEHLERSELSHPLAARVGSDRFVTEVFVRARVLSAVEAAATSDTIWRFSEGYRGDRRLELDDARNAFPLVVPSNLEIVVMDAPRPYKWMSGPGQSLVGAPNPSEPIDSLNGIPESVVQHLGNAGFTTIIDLFGLGRLGVTSALPKQARTSKNIEAIQRALRREYAGAEMPTIGWLCTQLPDRFLGPSSDRLERTSLTHSNGSRGGMGWETPSQAKYYGWAFWRDDETIEAIGEFHDNQPEGRWLEFHDNGTPWRCTGRADGRLDGPCTHWYSDGGVMARGTMKSDEPHGIWEIYVDGACAITGEFDQGRPIGTWWFRSGDDIDTSALTEAGVDQFRENISPFV